MKKMLFIIIILLIVPICSLADTNGKCGDNCYYEFNSGTGTLRIFGSGDMYDFKFLESPWFSHNESITQIIVDEGITKIGNYAFHYCESIQSVSLPETITEIGKSAFSYSNLSSITLPKNLEYIGIYAFSNTKISKIVIPTGVKTIEYGAFWWCSSLKSVSLPSDLENIYDYAFAETAIQSITLPDSLLRIRAAAFYHTKIKSIVIPQNVIELGLPEDSSECDIITVFSELTEIYFTGNAPIIENFAFSYNKTSINAHYPENNSTYDNLINNTFFDKVIWIPYSGEICDHHSTDILPYVAPTCTNEGLTEGKYCTICGDILILQNTIPKKDHTIVIDPAVESTCSHTGLTEGKHCSVCNTVLVKQNVTKKKDHAWGEIEYTWFFDGSLLTASHVCKNNSTHTEKEIVEVNVQITSPTETTEGSALYVSGLFSISGATQQTKYIIIPALKNLSVMRLPDMLTRIGVESFSNLNCEAVIVPDKCEFIDMRSFANCVNLTYISIPAKTSIDISAFEGCDNYVVDRR